jgi:hypothetical protein
MARYLFFRSSRSAYGQITDLFDFVWPTIAALWNLRWQVQGFIDVHDQVTSEQLDGRFVVGSGIHGANLKRACVEQSWENQQSQFAKFLLIDLFALYEGWLSATLGPLGLQHLEKPFQFPTTVANGKTKGLALALTEVGAKQSQMLVKTFDKKLRSHPKNTDLNLDALLICYRCFKEYRNCLMHNGGIVTAGAKTAAEQYALITASDLGSKEKPSLPILDVGAFINLPLRPVVGFSDVILRLIATLDARLAVFQGAEREFKAQWIATNGRKYTLKTKEHTKRERQVQRLISKLALPRPTNVSLVEQFLKDHQLVG